MINQYEVLEEQTGYKIVKFDKSFFKHLKKGMSRNLDKSYKLLNPGKSKKQQFTPIPVLYNSKEVAVSFAVSNMDARHTLGFIVDKTSNNSLFNNIRKTVKKDNSFQTLTFGDLNIVFSDFENYKIEELKEIINEEVFKFNASKKLTSNIFSVEELSDNEKEFIQDKMKESLIWAIDENIEILESQVLLTQSEISKLVIRKKYLETARKMLEALNINFFMYNNIFYFDSSNLSNIRSLTSKLINGELILDGNNVFEFKENEKISVPEHFEQKTKHKFVYKDIEDLVKNKKDISDKEKADIEYSSEEKEF